MAEPGERRGWLEQDDDALARACSIDRIRGSGRGGQKRNKTATQVRVRHEPTGLVGQSDDTRSQHSNKAHALARLREAIALEVREPIELDGEYEPPAELRAMLRPSAPGAGKKRRHTAAYLEGIAALLDLFERMGASLADTARILNVSSGAVAKVIRKDERLQRKVAEMRKERGLGPIR